jgi:predicted glycoside hydrolase/deacetylase ChbG (UPF0249 family)
MPDKAIRLIVRGDDAGSSHAANRAIRDAHQRGILRNAGVMAPGHAFDEAAEMLRGAKGLCVGLHATINCEWRQLAWPPVLPARLVPSLLMPDGSFFKDTVELWNRRPSNDEVLAELKAQLEKARAAGLAIEYMDTHMGFEWFHGLADPLRAFAKAEGLFRAMESLSALPETGQEFADPAERLLARLRAAEPGKTYRVVGHPAYDDEEMRGLAYGDEPPGKAARERDGDRRMLMDARVVEWCRARGVELLRFSDLT